MDSKHKAVWDWFYKCPLFSSLFFVFSESENGDTVIAPTSIVKDDWAEKFIDDTGFKNYDFAIIQYNEYTTQANVTQNIDILEQFEKLAKWIDTEDKAGRFPNFGGDCHIQSVSALPSGTGGIAGQDEHGAKFMFMCRIYYYDESELK